MRPPDIQYKIVHINISPVHIKYIRYVCLLFTPLIIQGILTGHFSGTYILGECTTYVTTRYVITIVRLTGR
jgi:hypothetical protein